ncbi:ABC bile acid [Sesbania bispinosa]|nr:ABC bile acid [Sesbania bispinosa]
MRLNLVFRGPHYQMSQSPRHEKHKESEDVDLGGLEMDGDGGVVENVPSKGTQSYCNDVVSVG